MAVGSHIARCARCTNGYRALTSRGTISAGFVWSDDGRDEDPRELLEREGLRFDSAGHAAPEQRHAFR
jgi:hypothetical protein